MYMEGLHELHTTAQLLSEVSQMGTTSNNQSRRAADAIPVQSHHSDMQIKYSILMSYIASRFPTKRKHAFVALTVAGILKFNP